MVMKIWWWPADFVVSYCFAAFSELLLLLLCFSEHANDNDNDDDWLMCSFWCLPRLVAAAAASAVCSSLLIFFLLLLLLLLPQNPLNHHPRTSFFVGLVWFGLVPSERQLISANWLGTELKIQMKRQMVFLTGSMSGWWFVGLCQRLPSCPFSRLQGSASVQNPPIQSLHACIYEKILNNSFNFTEMALPFHQHTHLDPKTLKCGSGAILFDCFAN